MSVVFGIDATSALHARMEEFAVYSLENAGSPYQAQGANRPADTSAERQAAGG